MVIPIGVKIINSGTHTLSLSDNTLTTNHDMYLKDTKENISVKFSTENSYSFDAIVEDDPNRFQIHFSPVGVEETPDINTLQVYTSSNSISIINNLNLKGEVKVVNIMGQTISTSVMDGNTTINSIRCASWNLHCQYQYKRWLIDFT